MKFSDLAFWNTKDTPIRMAAPFKEDNSASTPVGIKAGRQSEPETVSLLSVLKDELSRIEPDFELGLIKVIEHLAKYNSEVSYAIDNIVQLGNTPYIIYFGDGVDENLAKDMVKVAKSGSPKIYGGGLNSLINDLLAQAAITGAVSAECIPSKGLDDIQKTVLVNTGSIKFLYDEKTHEYLPHQKVGKTLSASISGNLKPLNTATYKYYALRRFGEKPYAIPPLMSALESITLERDMMKSFRFVAKKLGVFGFMSILFTPPKKRAGMAGQKPETDEEFAKRATAYLESMRAEAEKGFASGLNLGYKGVHEFDMKDTNVNVQGAKELFNLVSEYKMAGLKQDPLMLGRNYNVAETMARVILAKLTTQIRNYQMLVASFLQDYFALKLLLNGYNQVANLTVEFEPAMVSDKAKEEEAYGKRIDNQRKLYQDGIISQQTRAQALGYEEPEEEEPLPVGMEEGEAGVPRGTKKPAVGKTDPTDTKDKKASKTSNSLYLTKHLISELVGVPENGEGCHIADFMLENGDIIEDVRIYDLHRVESQSNFNPADVVSMDIATVSDLEDRLGADVPTFPYNSCSHGNFSLEHFEKTDRMTRYLAKYFSDSKAVFGAATKKVAKKIGVALAQLGENASVQQVQDKVFYVLFKEWGKDFSAPMQKVVRKNIEVAYKAFRTDKDVFNVSRGTNVPNATFGLRDARTMTYFKNSDSLYLGKFITDEDTKKKITEFIKQKYFEEGLPIGKDSPALAAFKEEFSGVLQGAEWKILRVLSTTVNKMRNYASVAYMQQAGVESFEIRGVVDRMQCPYCKAMQGRKFTVAKALSKLDTVVSSSPEYVKTVAPFATDVFQGEEGLEELKSLTDEQVQERGYICLRITQGAVTEL